MTILNKNYLYKFLTVIVIEFFLFIFIKHLIYNIYLRDVLNIGAKFEPQNFSLLIELIIINIIFIFCLQISRKLLFSLILTLSIYLLFIYVIIEKINFLGTPLYWVDFKQIEDLFDTKGLIQNYIVYFIPFFILVLAISIYVYRQESFFIKKNKSFFTLLTLNIFLVICSFTFNDKIINILKQNNSYYRINPDYPTRLGFKIGYLNNFVQTAIFKTEIQPPDGYTCDAIKKLYKNYFDTSSIPQTNKYNVILILAEAFTDLSDSGLYIEPEPQPVFRSIRNNHNFQYVLSPVYGGKSVNAEFELLTGFSMELLPIGSIPYRELVNNIIYSINDVLKDMWATALQVVNTTHYGYSKIYQYLNFDNVISLHGLNYEFDPSKKYASSKELAKNIIKIESSHESSFTFVFPNSSHAPWDVADYENKFSVFTKDLQSFKDNEVYGYIGAMNHIDLLLKILTEYYSKSHKKTLILILGDHQPALKKYNNLLKQNYSLKRWFPDLSKNQLKFVVPMGIWSNFNYIKKENKPKIINMNLVQVEIFRILQFDVRGFQLLLRKISNNIGFLKPNFTSINYSYENNKLLKAFELLQYDQISGEKYADKFINENYNCK